VPVPGFVAPFGQRRRSGCAFGLRLFFACSVDNAYPRVYATSKISKTAANSLFGPFPSRAAAERYADEMLNLFLTAPLHARSLT